jgi:NADPH-dependent curcumin reductase CurA
VPDVRRLRFQGFKPAVVPAFLDVMSGGNIGKTIVDIAG